MKKLFGYVMQGDKLYFALVAVCLLVLFAILPTSCQHGKGKVVADADSIDWADSAYKLDVKLTYYYNNNLHDSLVMLVPAALDMCRQHKVWQSYYNIWRTLGQEYVFTGQPDSAMMEAQKMHDDAIERGDSTMLATADYIKGLSYDAQGNHTEAALILEQALNKLPEKEYTLRNSIYLYYLTELHFNKDTAQMRSVLPDWKQLLQKEAQLPGVSEVLVCNHRYFYYRSVYFYEILRKDYRKASLAIDSICYESEKVGWSDVSRNEVLEYRSEVAIGQNDWQTALKLSDQLLENANNQPFAGVLNIKMQRAKLMANMERWKEAYELCEETKIMSDSIRTAESVEQLNELNKRFELDELKMQAERERMASERRQLFFVFAIVVLILLGIVLFGLYRYRSTKRMSKLRAAQERIENELKIARDIQMSMAPSTFPEREGLDMYAAMTPAKEVGGDLYGYVLNGDKLYFALGDVSGKGVPASLFMAQATRLFMTLAKQGMMPAEICTRMNDALSGNDNESGMFVTFFLGLVDLTTGHLDFCNAGHNPPIIGGGENNADFLEMQPNAPIGLWPGLEYEGEEIDSIKGRPLFIYTDGLNEAENRQQEQFGDDRLLDILRHTQFDTAQQVIDTLKAEVEQHRDGAEPNDDLTMMCIRVD